MFQPTKKLSDYETIIKIFANRMVFIDPVYSKYISLVVNLQLQSKFLKANFPH